jgi:hypothetical protein
VLIGWGHREIGENHQKDEEVVYAERFLNQVAGEILQRRVMSPPQINTQIEQQSQRNPESSPEQRFFDGNDMSPAVKNPHVQNQQDYNKHAEAYPP